MAAGLYNMRGRATIRGEDLADNLQIRGGRRRRLLLLALIAIVAVLGWIGHAARADLREAVDFAAVAYVGSEACSDCHQDRHASWHRTWHRTMTQSASADSVRGHFDGAELNAFGGRVRPLKTDSGYAFEYLDPDSGRPLATLPVMRTVGSHRYQQYLTRDAGSETYYRLHYLWHIGEQRWVHMNAAFLGDDTQHFDAQVTTWNSNCVFCHNTGPEPRVSNVDEIRERARRGEQVDVRSELRFDTAVAELGIGCEACHGPGGEHLVRMQRLDLRWMSKASAGSDRSIVNPARLPGARANDVCGACHAGRTLPDVAALDRWMSEGPSYRPGDDLSQHVVALEASTPSPAAHMPDLYRNRFWLDGSIRLSAYEFQGMKASACAVDKDLTCIRCHSMHGGDPAGMLPEANRGDAPCLRCHQDYRDRVAEHSGHAVDSPGSRCMNCHMPKAVYGVMTIHRSHAITRPDVATSLAGGKPDACLNCHAVEAPAFALREDAGGTLGIARHDGADLHLADGLAALLAGDPVRQAVAAFELGVVEHAPSLQELPIRAVWLIAALADDRPAVRRFSWLSLRAIDAALAATPQALSLSPALATFDYTGSEIERARSIEAIAAQFAGIDKSGWVRPAAATALDADYRLDPAVRAKLIELGRRGDKQIDIGE
jgi:predicted CXXCH cytochrome family protein